MISHSSSHTRSTCMVVILHVVFVCVCVCYSVFLAHFSVEETSPGSEKRRRLVFVSALRCANVSFCTPSTLLSQIEPPRRFFLASIMPACRSQVVVWRVPLLSSVEQLQKVENCFSSCRHLSIPVLRLILSFTV